MVPPQFGTRVRATLINWTRICHQTSGRFSATDPKTQTAALERVKGTLQPRETRRSAHDTAVRQSTLPSQRGHHATSASAYLHFHCRVPFSRASLHRDSATLADGWPQFYVITNGWATIRSQ